MRRRKYAARRSLARFSSSRSHSRSASILANVRSNLVCPARNPRLFAASAAASASRLASSSAAEAALRAAAASSISPCSSRMAGRYSRSHSASANTAGSPRRSPQASAASCAATERRIAGGTLGCRTETRGGVFGYRSPGGKWISSQHGRQLDGSSAGICTVHRLGSETNASSKMLSSAKASSARSPRAEAASASASASSASRSLSLFGCNFRSNTYVASCSVHPVRSSASRDSARVNPYAPSRASIARCRSATCGSSRAAVPAKAARSSAAASLSSLADAPEHVARLVWSRAVAAAASRASSTRLWAALSEAEGPSATASTRKLSGISSRGAKTQSQSTHSANRDSVAALRAFVTRFRLCTGVRVSSSSSSARNASKSNAPSRSGHRAAASSAHFFSKPALVRRRTIPSRRSALSRATRAFSSRRSASLAARAPSVTACASCAASRSSTASAEARPSKTFREETDAAAPEDATVSSRSRRKPSAGASTRVGAVSAALARAARAASASRSDASSWTGSRGRRLRRSSETASCFSSGMCRSSEDASPSRCTFARREAAPGTTPSPSNPPPSPRPRHPFRLEGSRDSSASAAAKSRGGAARRGGKGGGSPGTATRTFRICRAPEGAEVGTFGAPFFGRAGATRPPPRPPSRAARAFSPPPLFIARPRRATPRVLPLRRRGQAARRCCFLVG